MCWQKPHCLQRTDLLVTQSLCRSGPRLRHWQRWHVLARYLCDCERVSCRTQRTYVDQTINNKWTAAFKHSILVQWHRSNSTYPLFSPLPQKFRPNHASQPFPINWQKTGILQLSSKEPEMTCGTDDRKQTNRITHLHLKQKKTNKKLALAKTNTKLQNPGLVAFYDIQPENAASLFASRKIYTFGKKKHLG